MALELRFTLPGHAERSVPLDQPHIKIGALLSNQIVLRAPGVDPIHALIEEREDGGGGSFLITDLGSATGVKVNGRLVDVEAPLGEGDHITIGSVVITVAAKVEKVVGAGVPLVAPIPGQADTLASSAAVGGAVTLPPPEQTVRVPPEGHLQRRSVDAMGGDTVANQAPQERKKDVLFSPRKARPSGDVLEVVAYWGDTVLDVELFHPSYKGFEKVTIGDPTKSHLIAAGKDHFESHTIAAVGSSGFKLNLRRGMQTRLRKGGKVEKVENEASVSLGSRDIAHVKYGAVSYFMMFVRPPSLNLPKSGPSDPLFLALMAFATLIYFVVVPAAILHTPAAKKDGKDDDVWQVVQVPEKDKPPEKEKPKEKPPEPKKPPQRVADKQTPPKKPPKPEPKKDIKPAEVVEKEKPKQVKPVEKPVEKPKVQTQLAQTPTPPAPTKQAPSEAKPSGPPTPNPTANGAAGKPGPKAPNNQGTGMASTGAKSPDFKLAGPSLPNTALGKSGGVVGSGMNQVGGAIKGTGKADYKGVEGVDNNKASGVNLSKLGLGVGNVLSKTGAGAINTNFQSSAGGAGGGMGSASKTYGMGGVGAGKSMGLAGAGGAVNNFGSGSGGLLGGQGGTGGAGGSGLAGAFGGGGGNGGAGAGGPGGRGRANVTVPPGDPVVSGGLTAQEIMAVIRANLNQIRHCYEQLLQRSPNAAGKMATTFVIGVDGRVQSVNVGASTISDSVMRGCVTGKIQRWAFPKPRGGAPVTVNYPFVFNPL